jgi:uncharacterized damage-inducible protein DinB
METRYGAPVATDEKTTLEGMLDHHRALLLEICSGLSDEDLRRPMVPSGTSLLGIIKHLSFVERGWFQEKVGNEALVLPFDAETDPDGDWRIEDGESTEDVFSMYRASIERSREAMAHKSLDDLVEFPKRRGYSVRWVLAHMLEETARHAGQADILRELIDGRTGTGY